MSVFSSNPDVSPNFRILHEWQYWSNMAKMGSTGFILPLENYAYRYHWNWMWFLDTGIGGVPVAAGVEDEEKFIEYAVWPDVQKMYTPHPVTTVAAGYTDPTIGNRMFAYPLAIGNVTTPETLYVRFGHPDTIFCEYVSYNAGTGKITARLSRVDELINVDYLTRTNFVLSMEIPENPISEVTMLPGATYPVKFASRVVEYEATVEPEDVNDETLTGTIVFTITENAPSSPSAEADELLYLRAVTPSIQGLYICPLGQIINAGYTNNYGGYAGNAQAGLYQWAYLRPNSPTVTTSVYRGLTPTIVCEQALLGDYTKMIVLGVRDKTLAEKPISSGIKMFPYTRLDD